MPFRPRDLTEVSTDLTYSVFRNGDYVSGLASTEFWVPPYGFDFAGSGALSRMDDLKVIQTQSAGVEDIAPFVGPDVTLCNARGVHDAATSELGVGLMIASLRQIPRFIRAQDKGRWDRDQMSPSLADRHVLIVGYGSIGQALERRLTGFECEITRVAKTARDNVHGYGELPALIPAADVIVLLPPLTPQTRHLADATFLSRMKEGALLVNLGRGPLVDTHALIAEVSTGRISAALDVTDPEPLPPGHPLWSAPNVLITPHVGGGTSAMAPRIMGLVAEQLARYAAGRELLNVIRG